MEKNIEDTISVIVPVYNAKEFLEECVSSIIQQSYTNLDIILVDDGSTDGSGELCESLKKKDSRIKVIHKENGGVSSARNKGLSIATGNFIGFVDSDDVCKNDMYEKMINIFKNDDSVDFCYCDIFQDKKVVSQGRKGIIDKESKLKLIFPFGASVWNGLFKREKLKNIYFDERFFYGEDLLFLVKYLKHIDGNIFHLDCPLYVYKTNNSSITNQKGREKLNNIYKNYILATKESYNELKDSAIYEDIYSKKYIDLIYHVCQKLKDINFKNIIYEELGGLKYEEYNYCYF